MPIVKSWGISPFLAHANLEIVVKAIYGESKFLIRENLTRVTICLFIESTR